MEKHSYVRVLSALLALAPVGLLIVVVNYRIDPANLFHQSKAEEVAEHLAHGQSVPLTPGLDMRLVKQGYAATSSEPLDILVLGSSRCWEIRGNWFPGRSFFNSGVPAALLQDCLAIYESFLEKRGRPKLVILGTEPWFFNRTLEDEMFHGMFQDELRPAYDQARKRLGLSVERTPWSSRYSQSRYLELCSPAYFQRALKTWWTERRKGPSLCSPRKPTDALLLADGSVVESTWMHKDVATVRSEVVAWSLALPSSFYFNGYTEMDEDLVQVFERFVEDLQRSGTQVVFFLPPCHPMAYKNMIAKYAILREAEQYYRQFGRQQDIRVVGSFDPGSCECGEADFYDAKHPRYEAVKRLLQP